eukprot:5912894-Prymnesium_polylepis.1
MARGVEPDGGRSHALLGAGYAKVLDLITIGHGQLSLLHFALGPFGLRSMRTNSSCAVLVPCV